jgi:hypothetical protein
VKVAKGSTWPGPLQRGDWEARDKVAMGPIFSDSSSVFLIAIHEIIIILGAFLTKSIEPI